MAQCHAWSACSLPVRGTRRSSVIACHAESKPELESRALSDSAKDMHGWPSPHHTEDSVDGSEQSRRSATAKGMRARDQSKHKCVPLWPAWADASAAGGARDMLWDGSCG